MTREREIPSSNGTDDTVSPEEPGGEKRKRVGRGRYQLDDDGQFVGVDEEFLALTGWDRESLLGEHVSTVVDETDVDRYEVAVGKLAQASELTQTELAVTLRTPDGESVPCTIELTALAGDETGWQSVGVVEPNGTAGDRSRGDDTPSLSEQVLENAQETVFAIDADRRFAYINSRIGEFYEGGTATFQGAPLDAVMERIAATEEDKQRCLDLVDDLLAGNDTEGQIEICVETATETLAVDLRLAAVESDGDVAMLVGTSRDITDEVHRRTELQRERDLNEYLLRTAPVGIVVHSADGEVLRANERAETILGQEGSTLEGEDCDALASTFVDEDGESIPPAEFPIKRVIETGESVFDYECGVVHPDGELRWALGNAVPVHGPGGELDRVIGVFSDITEQRERARELETERAFTEAIHNSVPDLVYAFDNHGRFIRWNERGAEVSGYDDDELAGMHVLEFIPEADHEMVWNAVEDVQEGAVERRETHIVTKDGTEIPYEFSAAPIVDEDGDLFGFAGVGHDISEQKARERTLKEQNERLERLNRINAVIRDIDQALVSASTREEIEEAVCERLAAADTYQFAWIGRERQTDQAITPKATAGQADGYLEEFTLRTDESPAGQGPAGRAYRTREIQVCQNVKESSTFEPIRETVDAYGFESVAAIPIVYEDTVYGVLSVYADEPFSFGEMEQAVLAELGETIGHAISSMQAKRALLTERVTEVTVELRDEETFLFALSERADCALSFEGGVFRSDDKLLYYVTVDGATANQIRDVVAEFPYVEGLRIVSEYDEVCVIEMEPPSPSTLELVSDHGGAITEASASGGTATVTFEFPSRSNVNELLTLLNDKFDEVTLVSQRDTEQSVQTRHQFREALTEQLTDRQQAALEIAYYADYFDWPRGSTGEELADTLNVSAPTFHKHLRLAEQKLVGTILDDLATEGGG